MVAVCNGISGRGGRLVAVVGDGGGDMGAAWRGGDVAP